MNDSPTGLIDRRSFQRRLRKETATLRRDGPHLSALLLDVDELTTVTATFGPAAGDGVLRELERRLHSNLRNGDACAPYRGETFALLLPETSESGAVATAERLRLAIAARPFSIPGAALDLTVSIGCATASTPDAGRHLLRAADRALRRAKRAGRNRVAIATPEDFGAADAPRST